ncbi:uncharacterized protein LOC122261192 [Penaeus japonicus]|uniref:uncharacterized protein LOC122261192 n=1 Tax=Penaeus japonicus TaxID=27405 RepID=UPI001C713493|nr:uncharacterized protein LOC122261192 [Penaeus japonicus]
MVSGSCLNNNSMDTYKLLDLSGSDSENEVIHFAPMPDPPQRKKRLKRRERDLLRVSQNQVDEETGRVCSCMNISVGGSGCQPWISSPGGAVRSALLLIALIGLSLLTWLALHLQARLDATQNLINSGEIAESCNRLHSEAPKGAELCEAETVLGLGRGVTLRPLWRQPLAESGPGPADGAVL